MKICATCGEQKPFDEFYSHYGTKDKLTKSCIVCEREKSRNSYAKNRERVLAQKKLYREQGGEEFLEKKRILQREWVKNNPDKVLNSRLKAAYGISLDQYNHMIEIQDGVCAICKGLNQNGRALSVDHDHNCCSGKKSCGRCVRKLLCMNCNSMIGYAKENIDTLPSAIEYIKYHEERVDG